MKNDWLAPREWVATSEFPHSKICIYDILTLLQKSCQTIINANLWRESSLGFLASCLEVEVALSIRLIRTSASDTSIFLPSP